MPRGDGTGPMGAGPMTGRAAGYCAGWGMPGYANNGAPSFGMGFGRGRGMGMGRGGGRGWRTMYYATGLPGWQRGFAAVPAATPEQQKSALKSQTAALEQQLTALKQRLSELEGQAEG